MKEKSSNFWLISLIIIINILHSVKSSQIECDQENPSLQCLLLKNYPQMNDELACQLCAVALQSGKYPQKTNQYCTLDSGEVRDCGLTSFAYLLSSERFTDAFDTEYEIFYRDPFSHDQRVSAILKKQNIRSKLLNWLQNNIENSTVDNLLDKAIVNLYIDDINESQKQLQSYLSQNNEKLDKRTIKLKCRIYEKQGQFNEALNLVAKYIKQGERDQRNYNMLEPYLYHLHGNLLMHHLKFDLAIVQFTKASRMFKSVYQKHIFYKGFKFSNYNIGLCYQKLGKFEEATKQYIELIKHSQKNAEVLNALGNSFIQWAQQSQKLDQDKIKKGIFYLIQAIKENSQYYIAHYNLGYAYLKLSKYQEAIQKFLQSLSIKKTFQAEYALLTAYFLSGKQEQAENFISNNMTINDQTIDDLLSVYYQYSDHEKNPKFYDRILSQYEDRIKSANGHYWKAMIDFDLQKYGLAIDHFLQAYDKGYNEPHLLFNLGYAYELIGQYQLAFDYYTKAYQKDPRPETKQKIQECKIKIFQKQNNQEL